MKTKTLSFTILACLTLLTGCQQKPGNTIAGPNENATVSKKINIVASFYPLEFLAQEIGGSAVTVTSIVPNGIEPHDYEPTPQDIQKIYASDILVYLGAGLDPWAEKLAPELQERGIGIVKISEGVTLREGAGHDEHEEGEAEEEHESDEHTTDPHIWLDPVLMKQQVTLVERALKEKDPQNASVYASNREKVQTALAELDAAYRASLSACRQTTVISSHAAFNYLAARYNLTVESISGLSPEGEPSPKTLASLTLLARRNNIKYILMESLVSPKLAETLASETGTQTIVFNPLEGLTPAEQAEGKTYFTIMRENLKTLQKALECDPS